MTKILVDIHEPEQIARLLQERGLEIERTYLQSGDYVFSNIGIERKTLSDFHNTLNKQRLWKQVFNLKDCFERPILIVDQIPNAYNWGLELRDRRSIDGAMSRIVKLGVSMFTIAGTSNAPVSDIFLDIIEFLYLSSEKKDPSLKPVPRKGDRFSTAEVTEDMLCMFPGIGRETAKEIILRYPTMDKLCLATLDEIAKIPRLGPKKSSMVYEVLHIDKKFGIDKEGIRVKRA